MIWNHLASKSNAIPLVGILAHSTSFSRMGCRRCHPSFPREGREGEEGEGEGENSNFLRLVVGLSMSMWWVCSMVVAI